MKTNFLKTFFLLAIFFMLPNFASAATYYASPSGSGTTCLTGARCTLATGIGKLTAGDTLILGDGTYTGTIYNPPSGSAGAYITLKAENDGMAVITSTSANAGGSIIQLGDSTNYFRIEGLKVVANGQIKAMEIFGNYNKIFRSAFVTSADASTDSNFSNVGIMGNYNLLEDCWAWGGGRYKFLVYGGNSPGGDGTHNILRRCVARHDKSLSTMGQAGFANYTAKDNIFQNCIVIDSDQYGVGAGVWDPVHLITAQNYESWRGAWFNEKSNDLDSSGPTTIRSSIALNHDGPLLYDSNPVSKYNNFYLTDVINWDADEGFVGWDSYIANKVASLDHVTVGATGDNGFLGCVNQATTFAVSTNSIYTGIAGAALRNVGGANNYNSFYNNTTNRTGSTTGANDITNVNPLTASLRYLPRIESGSPLKGAGSGGSDIGATVMYKWGTSGTIYGETGYDTITTDSLWPWPNEDRIKTDMSSYPSAWPGDGLPNPVRGFTATGNGLYGGPKTLTSYIWEYLGNTCPSGICTASNDTTAPSAPSSLSVQ